MLLSPHTFNNAVTEEYFLPSACVSREDLVSEAKKLPVELEHEKEWKLARTLLKLPDVLIKITEELYLHSLCEYLFEVKTLNYYYLFHLANLSYYFNLQCNQSVTHVFILHY